MAVFQTSCDSRRAIDHIIHTLDLLPQTPLIRDGRTIFTAPYHIRLTVRYSLAEVFNEHWLAAQTGLGDIEAILTEILHELKRWKTRLKTVKQEGLVMNPHRCGIDWRYIFKSGETSPTEAKAWEEMRILLQLLLRGHQSSDKNV